MHEVPRGGQVHRHVIVTGFETHEIGEVGLQAVYLIQCRLPISSLPAGTYELRIVVRNAGGELSRTAFFTLVD